MSKELDDAYFRSTPCTHHEPLLSKLVDCVDLLEERIKGLLGSKVYVGETNTLPAGSEATASASKRGYDTVLDFGIPKGEKGDPGDKGDPGEPGAPGSDATATDVRIAGKSITADGVANIPFATNSSVGVVGGYIHGGLYIDNKGMITTNRALVSDIDGRAHMYKPIVPSNLDYAVKAAMCDGKGAAWTADEQSAARERMNAADANKVYIMQKQIENLQGISATEETDSTEAYTKDVPAGAQKWASLDRVGGKTVVNDGELVSAEVVEVESRGKNLAIVDTFPIPEEVRDMCPGYGWSAGTVCNEIDFERKVYVQRVGSVDLGTLTWKTSASILGREGLFVADFATGFTFSTSLKNAICSLYQQSSGQSIYNGTVDKAFAINDMYISSSAERIYVRDNTYTDSAAFKAAMAGVQLYYELDTPIEVDLSYALTGDHFIEFEAGGTVTFKQASTQLPVPSSVTYQISTSEVIANA